MKTQVVLTLEFDPESQIGFLAPSPALPSSKVVTDLVNNVVRGWVGTNPFALRNPEHLSVTMLPAAQTRAPQDHATAAQYLVGKLTGAANDLNALAEVVANQGQRRVLGHRMNTNTTKVIEIDATVLPSEDVNAPRCKVIAPEKKQSQPATTAEAMTEILRVLLNI